jgi:hypothetical protein
MKHEKPRCIRGRKPSESGAAKGKEEASGIFSLGTKPQGMSSSLCKFDGKTPPQKGAGKNLLDANCI